MEKKISPDKLEKQLGYSLCIVGVLSGVLFFIYDRVASFGFTDNYGDMILTFLLTSAGAIVLSITYFSFFILLYGLDNANLKFLDNYKSIFDRIFVACFPQGVVYMTFSLLAIVAFLEIIILILIKDLSGFDLHSTIQKLDYSIQLILLFCSIVFLVINPISRIRLTRQKPSKKKNRNYLFKVVTAIGFIALIITMSAIGWWIYMLLGYPTIDVEVEKFVYSKKCDNLVVIKTRVVSHIISNDKNPLEIVVFNPLGEKQILDKTLVARRNTYISTYNLEGKAEGEYTIFAHASIYKDFKRIILTNQSIC